MKSYLYPFFLNIIFLIYFSIFVKTYDQIYLFCILFNLLNFLWIFSSTKNNKSTNFSKIMNLIFNFSSIIFLYPDLIVQDYKLNFFGEKIFIVQAFKLMIYYQFLITGILKIFEYFQIGNTNLNKIIFYDKNIIKPIVQINIITIILYLITGNKITNIFLSRKDLVIGSFFKVKAYAGGLNTFFIVFNSFIQFSAVIGFLYFITYLFLKFTKNNLKFSLSKIPNFYKNILFFIAFIFIISAFYSDVRSNLLYVIIPTLILFFSLGEEINTKKLKFSLISNNTTKSIVIGIIIFSFIIISQIQVYRRGNISFFQKSSFEFSKTQGVVQTDKNLYFLSELIKLVPKNGTSEGKKSFINIPYQFIPSLIAPNKPRITSSTHIDVVNSFLNNFNYKYTNTSVAYTLLGEFIFAFGKNLGFFLAVLCTSLISYLNIIILSKTLNSKIYPYLNVSVLSIFFLMPRSLFFYLTLFSNLIYSILILMIYIFIRKISIK